MKRNDPEDKTPGFEDEEWLANEGDAMRAEIAGYIKQAKGGHHGRRNVS